MIFITDSSCSYVISQDLTQLVLCSFLEFENLCWNKEEGHQTFSQRTGGEFRQPREW